MSFVNIWKKEAKDTIERYKPKVKYVLYLGSAVVCEINCSVALKRIFRSKIPLNRAKYFAIAGSMHLASRACYEQAIKSREKKE